MPKQYPIPIPDGQALPYDAADIAQSIGIELGTFLFPFLGKLDDILDKRLVRPFLSTIQVIIPIRSRVHGLLLSEMGALLREVARLHVQLQRNCVAYCGGTTSTQCTVLTELGRS